MFGPNRLLRYLPVVLPCFFSCEKEEPKTADPIVETISINLLGDSIYFTGRAIVADLATVEQFGFVVDSSQSPVLGNALDIIFRKSPEEGIFKAVIFNSFDNEEIYFSRAFIKFNTSLIFGNTISFDGQYKNSIRIDDFIPKQGLNGEFVKIYGSNFGINKNNLKVSFGKNVAKIVSISPERITVEIPLYNIAELTPIIVDRNGVTTVSENQFFLRGPKILSFTPQEGVGELEFTILGENFSIIPHRNTVFLSNITFGEYPATVLSATSNELKVKVDARRMFPDDYHVTVMTDDKTAVGKEVFTLNTTWNRLKDRLPVGLSEAATFEIDNKIYFCGGTTRPTAVAGRTNQLWQYDIPAQSWTRKADFPAGVRVGGVAFAINGKGYFGTGYGSNSSMTDFWEYNPVTDSWVQKASLPGVARSGAFGVTHNGKGYVGFGNLMDLWEYDPLINAWTREPDFTAIFRFKTQTVVFKDKLYVMGGITNSSTFLKELWSFDFSSKTWSLVGTTPFILVGSFYGNDKCYVLSLEKYFGRDQLRLFQFDPELNIIVKEFPIFPGALRWDGLYRLSSNILLFGLGSSGADLYNDMWEFRID